MKNRVSKLILGLLLIIFIFSLYTFWFKKPSHDREWLIGLNILPHIIKNGDKITIENIRDYRFEDGKPVSFAYQSKTFDINDIETVWFLEEPFSKWGGVAHTFFIFEFKDHTMISLSVEARREEKEKYSAFLGAFNNYEVIYIWGTPQDIMGRMVSEDAKIYMYKLNMPKEYSKNLFRQLIDDTAQIESEPIFYNTITSNCTNLLAKSANGIKKGIIPWHYSFVFPGYAARYLYDLNYIDNTNSFEDIKKSSLVSDYVKEHLKDNETIFSLGLIKSLPIYK